MATVELPKKIGRNSIPVSLVNERREYEVMLKQAGMSTATILKQVNAEAKNRGWGIIGQKIVEKDIANYYRTNRVLSVQDYDHADQMRSALLTQMEINMEKLSLHIANNNKARLLYDGAGKPVQVGGWKPFEYADSLEKLHKMQMDYAEVQNWNLGRPSLLVNVQQNNINNIYDGATSEFRKEKPVVIREFLEGLDLLEKKLREEEAST
jgi:hypothetical protein